MPRRAQPKRPLHDPNDPDCLGTHARRYLDSMLVRNYSPNTVTLWEEWLRYFLDWCEERSIRRPVEITRPVLERYQRHWHQHRKANGRPLSFGTQLLRLVPVRGLFRWLVRQNVITSNPAVPPTSNYLEPASRCQRRC